MEHAIYLNYYTLPVNNGAMRLHAFFMINNEWLLSLPYGMLSDDKQPYLLAQWAAHINLPGDSLT
ncbi:MAG: hypothetical protein NVS2B7_11800 [Herpetosiphon sp.]